MNLIDSYVKIHTREGFIETRDYDEAVDLLLAYGAYTEVKYETVQVFDNSVEDRTVFTIDLEDAIIGIGNFFVASVPK